MFENLSALQREQIFKVMTVKPVRANEVIIEEGALGDEMYIVDRYYYLYTIQDQYFIWIFLVGSFLF
jgi:hypothetical protein